MPSSGCPSSDQARAVRCTWLRSLSAVSRPPRMTSVVASGGCSPRNRGRCSIRFPGTHQGRASSLTGDQGSQPLHPRHCDMVALEQMPRTWARIWHSRSYKTVPGRVQPPQPCCEKDSPPPACAQVRARFSKEAEGVGFEPTRTRQRPSGFQDRRHRPLGEPSWLRDRTRRRPRGHIWSADPGTAPGRAARRNASLSHRAGRQRLPNALNGRLAWPGRLDASAAVLELPARRLSRAARPGE